MQQKIKDILSIYLKTPADQINAATAVDRSAVNSSILLHRMYAKLAAEGILVNDYQEIRTFGELISRVNSNTGEDTGLTTGNALNVSAQPAVSFSQVSMNDINGIGIDIEMVSAMPATGDFREDAFYTMNFSTTEIAYCILQTNPYASFAGLFAAKEAIVKADNTFKSTAFRNIPVQHLSGGKPFHTNFTLSISHTDSMAVAVAIPVVNHVQQEKMTVTTPVPAGKTPMGIWLLVVTSLLLSVIALFLIAEKK